MITSATRRSARRSAAPPALLLLLAALPGLGAGERGALIGALAEASIPWRESIAGPDQADFGKSDGAWIWVETAASEGALTSPDLLSSDAPILAVPLSQDRDSLGPGAEVALALIRRRIDGASGAKNISVVFYDPENSRGLIEFSGALEDPESSIVLILQADTQAPPALLPQTLPGALPRVVLSYGAGGVVAPLSLLQPLAEQFYQAGISFVFPNHYNELYKLNVLSGPESLEITAGWQIPSMELAVSFPPDFSPGRLAEILDAWFERAAVDWGNADLNYSVYETGGRYIFVPERVFVLITITINAVFLAFLLLSFLIRRNHMIALLKTGASHIWVSLAYFLGMFVSLFFVYFVFSLIPALALPDSPDGGIYGALLRLALASGSGLSLFIGAPVVLLSFIPLERRGGFYGFTALLFAALAMLFGIYVDLNTAHFFAWILVFSALGLVWDNPVLPVVFALLTLLRPALVLKAAVEGGGAPQLLAGHFLLRSLAASLILFPPMMALMRAGILAIRNRENRRRILWPIRIGLPLAFLILVLLQIFVFDK